MAATQWDFEQLGAAWTDPALVNTQRSVLVDPAQHADLLTRLVLDAAFEVHARLGPGFERSHYAQALALEFERRSLPFTRDVAVPVQYRGSPVGETRAHFVIGGCLLLEQSSPEVVASNQLARVAAKLRLLGLPLGLLVTFEVALLRCGIRRVSPDIGPPGIGGRSQPRGCP